MDNPIIARYINERIRPISENLRSVFARGVDMKQALGDIATILVTAGHITVDSNTGVLSVVGRSENELLLDGRQASYPQLTVEDFVQVINTFNYLLSIVDSNESFKNILVKSSIRPLDA